MAARAALNPLIAAYCTHLARKEDLQGPKIGAVAMLIATITDAPAILTLRAHDRNSQAAARPGVGAPSATSTPTSSAPGRRAC
jgi:hypothetical protein